MYDVVALASNRGVSDPNCGRNLGNASWAVSAAGIIISLLIVVIVVALVATAAISAQSHRTSPTRTSSCDYYNVDGSCYISRRATITVTTADATTTD